MGEPEKPFACTVPECGMTFTNEDHLHVHTKKHDMILHGLDQKAAFAADQTPTPTRFIRNCEEVGLFQDLQNVNPFDEGFKRAMEAKTHSIDTTLTNPASDDVLHTPQMVFSLMEPGDTTSYTTMNNHSNITINRSSSDESGVIKEYETTTISKQTNEVTRISREIGKPDIVDRISTTNDVSIIQHQESTNNKGVNETSVSVTNNVIKIHSNVEIRKSGNLINSSEQVIPLSSCRLPVTKDANVAEKNVLLLDNNKLQVPESKLPVMSQKSIDILVDSLTADCELIDCDNVKQETNTQSADKGNVKTVIKSVGRNGNVNRQQKLRPSKDAKNESDEDYEVLIKCPNGKRLRMTAAKEVKETLIVIEQETKNKLKEKIKGKSVSGTECGKLNLPVINTQSPNVLPIPSGMLLPVTLTPIIVTNNLQKIPINPLTTNIRNRPSENNRKMAKRKEEIVRDNTKSSNNIEDSSNNKMCFSRDALQMRSAASRRYRVRLKERMMKQEEEVKHLKRINADLVQENQTLKSVIKEHMKTCSNPMNFAM